MFYPLPTLFFVVQVGDIMKSETIIKKEKKGKKGMFKLGSGHELYRH